MDAVHVFGRLIHSQKYLQGTRVPTGIMYLSTLEDIMADLEDMATSTELNNEANRIAKTLK